MKRPLAKLLRAVRRRSVDLTAEPLSGVLDLGGGRFEATDRDAALLLRASSLPHGWVELDFETERPDEADVPPLLYFDSGNGFHLSDCVRLPPPSLGRIRALARLPQQVLRLRFNPLTRPGRFSLGRLRARQIGANEAGLRLAARIVGALLAHPSRIQPAAERVWQTFRSGGFVALRHLLIDKAAGAHHSYAEWHHHYAALRDADVQLIRRRIEQLALPRLSVVMPVLAAEEELLRLAVRSVREQLYPNWELCIVAAASLAPPARRALEEEAGADARIKLQLREGGQFSVAANDALALAAGELVAFLEPGDELTPHALYLLAEELAAHPSADFVYSDEDQIDARRTVLRPFFKPDWNPELLSSRMYVGHLVAYRTSLLRSLGGLRSGFDGSEYYDLCLRASARARGIRHIPHVLYHRCASARRGDAGESGLRALRDFHGPAAVVTPGKVAGTYHVRHPALSPPTLVSLIIPTRDRWRILERAIRSVLEKTSYAPYEMVVVDNQSRDPRTLAYLEELARDGTARVLRYDAPFNYSAINNLAVREARGEVVCLLNNDVEVIAADWLGEMVSHALRPGVGAVGAKLLYPHGSIQHAGVLLGLHGAAGHVFRLIDRDQDAYFGRPQVVQAIGAVTAACLAIRKETYLRVGGLDEIELKVAFNDVDLCLKLLEAGLRNVYCPDAELYHHESLSRGRLDTPENQDRERREIDALLRRWGPKLQQDPAHNPNLSLHSFYLDLACPPRVRRPWRTV